jgi:signal peptidase II
VLGIVAAGVMVWLLRSHAGQRLFCMALSLLLGGALGNVIDRLLHGYVVDFLDFYWDRWHFPAFNLADSAITLGAALMILDEVLRVRRGR